ncbi:MAG: VOC family protein [Chitinophagaceae bacterium]|nr:MAG: VOC family protein [Chitinophagaceae bacterium]
MTPQFKPEAYNSLSPYMLVNDASTYIDLLKTVFNAEPLRRFDREDGSVMHAEVRLDDSVIMISTATAEYPRNNTMLHLYVEHVDEVFARAKQHGFTVISDPVQQENDSDKRGMLADPEGNVWAVSTQVT